MSTKIQHLLKSAAVVPVALLIVLCFWALATFGTGNLIQPTLGTPFDSLALSLMKGEVGLPNGAVIYENIRVNGKNVIYFGAFPAFVRMPFLVLMPWTFGKLAPLVALMGGLFCAGAFYFVFREASRHTRMLFGRFGPGLLTLIFSLGTPLLYQVAVPTIYQEANIWALGFTLWAIGIFYRAFKRGWTTSALVLLSICTGGAILSRLTYGLPLSGLLAGAVVLFCIQRWQQQVAPAKNLRSLVLAAVPLIVAGSFQLWYNHARFGSPLVFSTWNGYEMESAEVVRTRAALGSFNARRIPFSFGEYLGIHREYLSPKFPYISPASPARMKRPPLYFSDSAEAMVSIAIACPVLIVASVLGILALFRRRFSALTYAALVFFGQVILICAWYFITFRYTAEFVPLAVVLTLAAFEAPFFSSRRWGQILLFGFGFLSIATMAVAVPRLVIYQTGIPESYRQMLKDRIGTGR